MQVDFGSPDGGLYVAGGEQTIAVVNEEIATAVGAGSPVFYTRDWHPPVTPHFAKDGGIWPVHCVADTWGAELHPDLTVDGEIIRKGSNGEDGYSGFTMRDPVSGTMIPTPLETMLRDRDVSRVVICGLATDYCVNATALDARRLGFETRVLMNAVAAVNLQPGDDERALTAMADAGAELVGS
jgi:nicotinamidase/pyrazinamidase